MESRTRTNNRWILPLAAVAFMAVLGVCVLGVCRWEIANREFSEALDRLDARGARSALRRGADIRRKGRTGRTALMAAAASNDPDLAKRAIRHGVRVDIVENSGNSDAIRYAALHGSTDVIRLLLAEGASPDGAPLRNATPLDLAVNYHRSEAVRLLVTRGGRVTPDSLRMGQQDDAGFLLLLRHARGAQIDAGTLDHCLRAAAAMRKYLQVEELVALGADPSARNIQGENALLHARRAKDTRLLRLLQGRCR